MQGGEGGGVLILSRVKAQGDSETSAYGIGSRELSIRGSRVPDPLYHL